MTATETSPPLDPPSSELSVLPDAPRRVLESRQNGGCQVSRMRRIAAVRSTIAMSASMFAKATPNTDDRHRRHASWRNRHPTVNDRHEQLLLRQGDQRLMAARRPGRVLVLGCGSVSQCTLPLLIRDLELDPAQVTIVDFVDNRARVAGVWRSASPTNRTGSPRQPRQLPVGTRRRRRPAARPGVEHRRNDDPAVVPRPRRALPQHLGRGVGSVRPHAVRHPLDRTLYVRHMALRRMIARWGTNDGPTAVVEHGANPGLVSHFTKQALIEIATRLLRPSRARANGQPRSRRTRRRAVQRAGDALGHEGHPHRRARHADRRSTQAGRRVRQHVVGRGLLRGRRRAGRAGLGHPRETAAAERVRAPRVRPAATRSASRNRAWRRGCARGCRAARSPAW